MFIAPSLSHGALEIKIQYKTFCLRELPLSSLFFRGCSFYYYIILELELIQTQMAQKPMLRAEVGMRVRCANKASAE